MAASESAVPFSYAQAAKRLSSSTSTQTAAMQEKSPSSLNVSAPSDSSPSANGASIEESKHFSINETISVSPKTTTTTTTTTDNAHSSTTVNTTVKETPKEINGDNNRAEAIIPSEEPLSQSTEPSEKMKELQHPKGDVSPKTVDAAEDTSVNQEHEATKPDEERESNTKQEAPSAGSHVNVWQKRKEEQEAKAKAAAAVKPVGTPSQSASGTPNVKTPTSTTPPRERDAKPPRRKDGIDTKDKKRIDTRKGSRSNKSTDTEDVENLPPVGDASSWPTPQHAQGEEMRKAQEKERERSFREKEKESSREENNGSTKERTGSVRGREKWVPVPYVPSTVFATPLPRRGGRTGRGGNRSVSYAGPSSSGPSGGDSNERVGRADSHHSHNHHRGPTERKSSEKQLNASDKPAPPPKETKSNSVGDVAASRGEAQSESHAHPHQRFHSLDRGSQKQERDVHHSQHTFQHTSQTLNGSNNVNNNSQRESRPRSFRRSFNHNNNSSGSAPYHTVPMPSHPFSHGGKGFGRGGGRMGIRSPSLPAAFYTNPAPFMQPADMSMYGYPAVGIPPDATVFGYPAFPGALPPHPAFMTGADMGGLPAALSGQIEYYFSVDNLCKDIFLRKHMDSQGWVPLSVIAGFKRVRDMTNDMETLRSIFANRQGPKSVEYKPGAECEDGQDRVRRRDTWQAFVLKIEDREESARNEGPKAKKTEENPSDQAESQTNEPKQENTNQGNTPDIKEEAPLAAAS